MLGGEHNSDVVCDSSMVSVSPSSSLQLNMSASVLPFLLTNTLLSVLTTQTDLIAPVPVSETCATEMALPSISCLPNC